MNVIFVMYTPIGREIKEGKARKRLHASNVIAGRRVIRNAFNRYNMRKVYFYQPAVKKKERKR